MFTHGPCPIFELHSIASLYTALRCNGPFSQKLQCLNQNTPLLGGPTIFEDLTDSPDNQHVFLFIFQNLKSKISEKSGQN